MTPETATASALTARVLDPGEWPARLEQTGLAGTTLNPDTAFIVVVEDRAAEGRVVGCWAAFQAVHVEGVWVAEDHRRKSGVARALLTTMFDELRARGVSEVMTGAEDPTVEAIIQKLGGVQLPGSCWLLRLFPPKEA